MHGFSTTRLGRELMLKDAENTFVEEEIIDEESSELYCAACGHLVTRTNWRIAVDGAYEHTFLTRSVFYFGS